MKILLVFLLSLTLVGFTSIAYAAPPVNKSLPRAQTVDEDTPLTFEEVKVEDSDGNLASVEISATKGKIKVTVPVAGGPVITGNDTAKVTLTGTQTQINLALTNFSYQGDLNFNGTDTLTVLSKDSATPAETDIDTTSITVTKVVANVCDWTKSGTEFHPGDLGKNISVGSVASYSLVQYNLADKKSSFNAKAAGFGLSFRWYTDDQLERFRSAYLSPTVPPGTAEISDIPAGCRAQTEDFLNEGSKIASRLSVAPTFYVFQDKDENDLGLQVGLNFGFFNDILTVGVGWNISGDDAGEWFILAGPSFGFNF